MKKNIGEDIISVTTSRSSLIYSVLLSLIITVVVVIAIAVILVWYNLNTLEQAYIKELSVITNGDAEVVIKADDSKQTLPLKSQAQKFEGFSAITFENWAAIANHHFSNLMLALIILLSVLTALSAGGIFISRKQAYRIRSDRQIMEHLFKNLPGMAYRALHKKDRVMEFVSEGCQLLSGYSKNDFEQRLILWSQLIHPDDYDDVYNSVQQAIKTDGSFEIEYRVLTKNKQIFWVWEKGEAFLSKASQLIRLEGFITDITAEKLSKLELIESRSFSSAVVDAVVVAVITINDEGVIETFNRKAQEMFGYSFEEIVGSNVKVLMPKPYAQEHDHYIATYLTTGVAKITNRGREVIAINKAGFVFPIHLSVSEIKNHSERKFVGLIRDLSQQHAAEKVARQHIEQIAHAHRLNLLGEMAAGIAHEINQPLTAISLFAQAAKRLFEKGNRERLPETFDKLSEQAQRAGAVIERMQIMAKKCDHVKEVIDCRVLTEQIVKLAEAEARIRDIKIHMDAAIDLPKVFVDLVQIQQVVLNLLRNGMDAMAAINYKHGNIIFLQVQFNDAKYIEIHVIDSGSGVSKHAEANLFIPFLSTKSNGMGMGLSISKSIVTEHGGQLNFHNNASFGSTFFFTVPIEKI
jgi:two-component system sensor kinase FixL